NVKKGERVLGTVQMAGTEIMRIANLNNMEVRVSVNENDIIRVQLGDSAEVEVDSYTTQNEKFTGIVTAIANTAKDALTAEAVTEFEVRVRLLPDSYRHLIKAGPGGRATVPFRPGMTASVDIIAERKAGVLSVPLAAVTTRSDSANVKKEEPGGIRIGGPGRGTATKTERAAPKAKIEEVVFIIKDGKAVLTPVKTGISDFQNIEIKSGLAAGTEVASGPFRAVSKTLKDGNRVVVKDAASLSKASTDDAGK
ncbi:MAG: HlyD family efflux transporter periplasmic adaptor subunit, partial [Hymenobacter sp.]